MEQQRYYTEFVKVWEMWAVFDRTNEFKQVDGMDGVCLCDKQDDAEFICECLNAVSYER